MHCAETGEGGPSWIARLKQDIVEVESPAQQSYLEHLGREFREAKRAFIEIIEMHSLFLTV